MSLENNQNALSEIEKDPEQSIINETQNDLEELQQSSNIKELNKYIQTIDSKLEVLSPLDGLKRYPGLPYDENEFDQQVSIRYHGRFFGMVTGTDPIDKNGLYTRVSKKDIQRFIQQQNEEYEYGFEIPLDSKN